MLNVNVHVLIVIATHTYTNVSYITLTTELKASFFANLIPQQTKPTSQTLQK